MFVFVDNQDDETTPEMQVLVYTDTIYHSGDFLTGYYTPGVYIVEVRAWADNSYDTGETEELQIVVIDPCDFALIFIDNSDSVFKSKPDVTLTQYLNYEALTISWDDTILFTNPALESLRACGNFVFELNQIDENGAEVALDGDVFPSVDLESATKTLDFYSTDLDKVGQYELRLTVFFENSRDSTSSKDFLVVLE